MKRRRPTKADTLLADPTIIRLLEVNKAREASEDVATLTRLFKRLHGRVMHPLRCQRCQVIVRRDPRDIALRYLRRHRGGAWYAGGFHVARLHYGPGIAFPGWANDQAKPTVAQLINATLALPSS